MLMIKNETLKNTKKQEISRFSLYAGSGRRVWCFMRFFAVFSHFGK